MNPIILLIDDDKLVMQFYVRALELDKFTVRHCLGPDEAFAFIEKEKPQLVAAVVDIMMLPQKRYCDADTDNGLKTGLFVYQDLRAEYPDTPIIILTNVSNQVTLDNFEEGPLLKVVQKLELPPFGLARLIHQMQETTCNLPSQG